MPTHTSFKDGGTYFDSGVSDTLEQNCACFLSWAFLGVGSFVNIERSTPTASGAYGGSFARLRLSEDSAYTSGRVWEGARRDWVWETGIDHVYQPIRVSGVWVNGTFYNSSTTGAYKHSVDYMNGRIIFDSPVSTTGVVEASYTYRYVHTTTADYPGWREVQQDSLRVDSPHYLQRGSGAWSMDTQSRLQLPAVIVEASPRVRYEGAALGGGTKHQQDVLFYVLAETPYDRKQIHDRLIRQWQKTLIGFNKDRVLQSGVYGLDADGFINPSGLMYPDLVSPYGYAWKQIRIVDVASDPVQYGVYGNVWPAVVRWTCETDLS